MCIPKAASKMCAMATLIPLGAGAHRYGHRVILERVDVEAAGVQRIVVEPREEFLFDKLVLMTPDEDFTGLTVESVRVGKVQMLQGPTPAALFGRAHVYPMPDVPPPKDPAQDLKDLLIGMWNIMNDRPARFGMDDKDAVGNANDRTAALGRPGCVYVGPDESIEIAVRNEQAETVLLGVHILGTVVRA